MIKMAVYLNTGILFEESDLVFPMALGIIMILAGFFTLLAGFMPYCFNKIPFLVGEQVAFTKYFYVSYFSRDVFLLLSFGTFCDRISTKYSEIK